MASQLWNTYHNTVLSKAPGFPPRQPAIIADGEPGTIKNPCTPSDAMASGFPALQSVHAKVPLFMAILNADAYLAILEDPRSAMAKAIPITGTYVFDHHLQNWSV